MPLVNGVKSYSVFIFPVGCEARRKSCRHDIFVSRSILVQTKGLNTRAGQAQLAELARFLP